MGKLTNPFWHNKEILYFKQDSDGVHHGWSSQCGVCGGGFYESNLEKIIKVITIHLDCCIASYYKRESVRTG